MPLILITNDDGIEAEGLNCLEEHLKELAEVIVVAPDIGRSGISHALTIDRSLRLKSLSPNRHTLDGTPADCVIHALRYVVRARPDLVISGINHGSNLADDIMYSGTVAAAREASKFGIPSIAVSQEYDERPIQFKEGARFVRELLRKMLTQNLDKSLCLNINIPVRRIKGVKITRQGYSVPPPNYADNQSGPETGAEDVDSPESEIMLDYKAVAASYISVTPLQRDQTDYDKARSLMKEAPRLFQGFRIPGFGLIR